MAGARMRIRPGRPESFRKAIVHYPIFFVTCESQPENEGMLEVFAGIWTLYCLKWPRIGILLLLPMRCTKIEEDPLTLRIASSLTWRCSKSEIVALRYFTIAANVSVRPESYQVFRVG
jgi:hypothetical protein